MTKVYNFHRNILFGFFCFLIHHGIYAQSVNPPENLKAEVISQTQINLTWDDSNKNKTYYVVERSTGNNNNFQEISVLDNNSSSYSDRFLTANTTYFYRIKGVVRRIFGESHAYSDIIETTTLPDPPAAPSDFVATVKSTTEIDLSWKDNSDDEEGFVLERSINNNSSYEEIASFPPNTTVHSEKDLKSNTTYFYRIRSFNEGGGSAYSQLSATTLHYPPTLSAIPDPAPINEDADVQTVNLAGISDGGDGGQKITVTATSDNKDLIPDPEVVYSSPNSTGSIKYKPKANKFGTAVITVTVRDDGPSQGPVSNSVSQSFKVTVNEINDPPTLTTIANPAPIFENSDTQTIQLSGISAGPEEVQTVSITATSSNPEIIPNPTVNYTSPATTGTLTYKPVANQFGKVTITVTVKDSGPGEAPHSNTFTRTFDVVVEWVNKAPTLAAITDPAPVYHSAGEQQIPLTGITAGPNDQQQLTVTATTNNSQIIQNLTVDYSSPESTGTLKYTPVPETKGEATITVTVKDDGPGTSPHVNSFSRTFRIRVTDIPLIAGTNFPEFYNAQSSDVIGITTSEDITVNKVELHYRGLNENDWKVEEVPGANGTYNVATPIDPKFGPVGMEYFFVVYANESLVEESVTKITYLNYPGEGLQIPDLKFGGTEEDYQIISIPLELKNNNIASVFEDDLGPYDPTQWRMFHYLADSAVEYNSGFTTVEPGLGYWLISRHNREIDTGEGSTFQVNREEPFILNLRSGWNQIGNPYNMDLLWQDVLTANGNPAGVGNLHVFENGLVPGTTLKRFQGGFVFSDSEITLAVPVVKPVNGSNGRLAANMRTAETDGWELNFNLSGAGLNLNSGGLGMVSDADLSKDSYDEIAVPEFGFIKYINPKFNHPEYFYPYFSKDIVPTADSHIWDLEISSNIKGEMVDLNWDSPEFNQGDVKLLLFDIALNKVIDMQAEQKYSFKSNSDNRFRIFYGNDDFIKENLLPEFVTLNKPFPNPFQNTVTFPFTISKTDQEVQVMINIYDSMGRLVATPENNVYTPGFYEISWNGKNLNGGELSPGLYVYKMIINVNNNRKEFTGRLVLK